MLDRAKPANHVVSVGTRSPYQLPLDSTLHELMVRRNEARVMCTEVNIHCGGQISTPEDPSRHLPQGAARGLVQWPESVRCAGTITFTIDDRGVRVIPSQAAHQGVINELPSPKSVPAT